MPETATNHRRGPFAPVCAIAQVAVLACSHQGDLDTIEGVVRANGIGGAGHTSLSTAGAPSVLGTNQPPSDGTHLAPGLPQLIVATGDFTHYDEHDRSLHPTPITIDGQPFTLGQRFPFGSGDGTPGSAGYFGPIRSPVAKDDLLRAFFWMRCGLPDPSSNQCNSAVVFELGVDPYTNGGLETPIQVGPNWTLFTQEFVPLDAYAVGTAQLTFRLGYPNQVLELGAAGLENYGRSIALERLEAVDQGPFAETIAADSFASYGTAIQSQPTGTSYPFGKALNFTTIGQSFNLREDSGLQGRTNAFIQANDLMLVTFWAHCVNPDPVSGACHTSVVFEEGNSPYVNAGLQTPDISVLDAWQQYFFPFRSNGDYAASQVKLGLRLGYPNQTIEFGPISLRRYDPSFTLADLPESSFD